MRINIILAMAHAWLGQNSLVNLHFVSMVAADQATRGPERALRRFGLGALAETKTDLQISYIRWDSVIGFFTKY